MNLDGEQRSTILNDPDSWITDMASCGDRYIVLSWAFHGGNEPDHIWRTNADGSNPTQLTNGLLPATWLCSPDGKWVYYFRTAQVPREHLLQADKVKPWRGARFKVCRALG